MKNKLYLFLICLFCVVLCLCLSPAAFSDDGQFKIPESATSIDDEAFFNCKNMVFRIYSVLSPEEA